MRHRTPRARGQPLRAVCPRNVVRLFRPKGRNWMPRIYSGHPTVRLPQTEAWAERERVPSGHNCRRQLATGRPEQIQEPGTAVPGTPIFANNAQRGGPPLESPCRGLSLVLSFASKESTAPSGRQPDHPRRSRRVMLQPRQGVCAYRRTKGLIVRPLGTFGHRSWRETHRTVSLSTRRSRRVILRRGLSYGKASAQRHKHGTASEQTISTARTAVRSVRCLPETRGANRLQQLCSSNPYFPPAPLRSLCKTGQIVLKQEP